MAGLRVLLAGGDVLQPESVRTVLSAFPSLTVINGYGPTENTTFTCCHAMTAATPPGATVPIGKPITGTTVRVLDENGRPVRRGEAGVLYAGGIGLALGYLNDPERTRAAFVDDPDGQDRKLYRTGDLVRERDDGTYEFIGRLDRQGEDPRVSRLGGTGAAGARDGRRCRGRDRRGRPGRAGEKRLVAFVQSPGDPAKVRAAVRQYLRQRLAGYMIPDVIEVQRRCR